MPQHIIKRDGTIENWQPERIQNAICKALKNCNVKDPDIKSQSLTSVVVSHINGAEQIHQEYIQDLVEKILMQSGFLEVAKEYILYRERRREIREQKLNFFNVEECINSYIERDDWRINENANMDYSFQGLTLNVSGKVQAKYILNKYSEDIRAAHEEGYIHIHDLSFGLAGYCAGWSLYDLILEGFNLKGGCSSGPAKHFDTILSQVINFIGTLQNEWAGAQAFNNFDTLLAPFIRYDVQEIEKKYNITLSKEYIYNEIVKQSMQRFLFNMNTTSRWGGQSPFSNLTMDLTPPKHLADKAVIIGGRLQNETYSEFQEEMDMINKSFLEILLKGDINGSIFSFPIPTYNVTENFPWDSEIGDLLLKMTAQYGIPYFQNFISSDLNPEDVRSMCCRLQMDKRQLKKHLNKTGGLFGAGDLTGSIGVVTLNLPKMAYLSKDKEEFFSLINKYTHIAKRSLEFKRKMLENNLDKGMYPWSKRYLKNRFAAHFSTIGIVGGHEACLNLINEGIETENGLNLMIDTLNYLRKLVIEVQEETGNLYNLEATPAEGTSYKLAKLDKKNHEDIISSGEDEPFYTNSTQLPVCATSDPFEALEHQNKLQTLYTGGTVFHTYIGEAVADPKSIKEFLLKAFKFTKIPYISITPTFSICSDHGYIRGEYFSCPKCDKDTEVYTRIVGYYRPVNRWNKGKRSEYFERQVFRGLQ